MIKEEHGIKIKSIKRENNQVANALSRLELTPYRSDSNEIIEMLFGLLHIEATELFTLSMWEVSEQQSGEEELTERVSQNSKRAHIKRSANDNDVILEYW